MIVKESEGEEGRVTCRRPKKKERGRIICIGAWKREEGRVNCTGESVKEVLKGREGHHERKKGRHRTGGY